MLFVLHSPNRTHWLMSWDSAEAKIGAIAPRGARASLDSALLLLCTTLLGVGLDVHIHRPLQDPPTPLSCPGLLLDTIWHY